MLEGRSCRSLLGVLAAAILAVTGPLRAAEPLDPLAVREAAAPRVCLVVVEGPLGLPLAYANGFLLGEGKFVVTDLASLAQPGAERATVKFQDGSAAVAKEFGMADAATGLAAIRIDPPKSGVGGLVLSTAAAEDGLPAVLVGWKWAEQIDLATAQLKNGVAVADLAAQLKVQAPAASGTLLTFVNSRPEIAAGAPLVDGAGGVVGVLVQMAGAGTSLAVPSGLLRGALLSSGASLKPFAELPKPVWPAGVQVVAGKPPTPQEFAGVVRTVKSRSRCNTCRGTGQVTVTKLVGTQRVGGLVRPIYRQETETCKTCNGEGTLCGDGMGDLFARMAEGAARIALAPETDEKVVAAARENVALLLTALAKVGPRYRDALVSQVADGLKKPDGAYPRGVVVYAQLQGTVDGPGGRYTLLAPFRAPGTLAVRADALGMPLGEESGGEAVKAEEGDWIVLAGLACGPASVGSEKPVFVRPFGWAWGPALGPKGREGGRHPGKQPRPKKPGEPDFFGL